MTHEIRKGIRLHTIEPALEDSSCQRERAVNDESSPHLTMKPSQPWNALIPVLLLLSWSWNWAEAFCPPELVPSHQQRSTTRCSRMARHAVVSPTRLPVGFSREFYDYDGWKLTYRYKAAEKGFEKDPPVLLIHPVGIGLSSWFWEPFMDAWRGPAVYAVDLIGCGIAEGGDAWDPDKRGLSFPLGWVQGCEALLQQKILPASGKELTLPFLSKGNMSPQCTVVAQGGLAPVGVVLAARNPDTVNRLVLTSPPTWKDMTTAVPEVELERNYDFLRSPVWGNLAFNLLESRWALEFFSNTFLFADKCDDLWIDRAMEEACKESRPPVHAFNAGFCNHRSFEEELCTLSQPTLVLHGSEDTTRNKKRDEYASKMRHGVVQTIPGQNVLPWESAAEVCKAILNFHQRLK
jgi:pimeloyl-ACP methyl ester carboxylesterase